MACVWRGIVALHAALVRQTNWEWFNQLAGCDFDSDSEYLEARVMVDPDAMQSSIRSRAMDPSLPIKLIGRTMIDR